MTSQQELDFLKECQINAGQTVTCPYCGKQAVLVRSEFVYGRNYGPIYICLCQPGYAFVGCHKGTFRPLGRLANPELREAKKRVHAHFDPLWQSRKMRRTQAYKWLAKKMQIPFEQCHIGMFDLDQCKKAMDILQNQEAK